MAPYAPPKNTKGANIKTNSILGLVFVPLCFSAMAALRPSCQRVARDSVVRQQKSAKFNQRPLLCRALSTALCLQLLKDLELFFGERGLPCTPIGLREAIVRLGDAWLKCGCTTELLDRFGVTFLIREENPELQKSARELWIEGNGTFQQGF